MSVDAEQVEEWADEVLEAQGRSTDWSLCEVRCKEDGCPPVETVLTDLGVKQPKPGPDAMKRAIDVCARKWNGRDIHVDAEAYLEDFYRSLGFVPTGKPFRDGCVMCVPMLKPAVKSENWLATVFGDFGDELSLRASVLMSPLDPSTHWSLGLFLASRGSQEAAEESLRSAMRAAAGEGIAVTAYSVPETMGGLAGYGDIIAKELEDFRAFCEASAVPALVAQPRLRQALPFALEELRRLPVDPSWQVGWATETARLFGPDPKSAAYGETLFSGMQEVMSHPAVDAAVAAGAGRVLLLGSALGYQCLFFLAAGLPCVGYDLLAESMVQTGRDTLRRYSLADTGIDLRAGDAREVPLGAAAEGDGPSVVWMNDEVWPQELREAMLQRAAAEMAPGSVLISYGPLLGRLPRGLRVAGELNVMTSWDPEETISILQRVAT